MNHTPTRRIALLLAALVLSGCAAVSKVATGEAVIRDRLAVTVDQPWNQFERGIADNTPTWTHEGITVDALQFYVGIKDGQVIAQARDTSGSGKSEAPLTFRASMQPAEIVALYQGLLTRDGSSFTLEKLEPAEFLGQRGFRYEYSLVRKFDDVRLRGVGWGAVRNGELFVIQFSAPRLAFFSRYAPLAEKVALSARVKG